MSSFKSFHLCSTLLLSAQNGTQPSLWLFITLCMLCIIYLMSPLMNLCVLPVLQATALSIPAPPACPTSRIAGTPRQEAAPLGVWASLPTHLQRATRTPDVQKDPLDLHGLSYPLTGLLGTDTVFHQCSGSSLDLLRFNNTRQKQE